MSFRNGSRDTSGSPDNLVSKPKAFIAGEAASKNFQIKFNCRAFFQTSSSVKLRYLLSLITSSLKLPISHELYPMF